MPSALARARQKEEARRRLNAHWSVRLETVAATGLAVLLLAAAVERALEVLR